MLSVVIESITNVLYSCSVVISSSTILKSVSLVLRCILPKSSFLAFGKRGSTVGCADSSQFSNTAEPSSVWINRALGNSAPRVVLPVLWLLTIVIIGGLASGFFALAKKLILFSFFLF